MMFNNPKLVLAKMNADINFGEIIQLVLKILREKKWCKSRSITLVQMREK